jgi:Zn-dependent membrane protease YugP
VTRGASQDEVSRSFEKFSQIFINFDEESNTNARELLQINGTIMLSK